MNFQQLRIIRETVRRNYNLTEVGNALYTSQSGVSKHIKDLEDELGIELFIRKGKRLLGLTDPGKELLGIVERMLLDAKNIKQLAEQFSQSDKGQLTIATTHTQARYALPKVVSQFKKAFPKVHLALHQGSPNEIAEMLSDGRADIGIATEAISQIPELATFPYYSWHHAVIVPKGHPLEKLQKISLEDLAEHPIVTYHEGFTGRQIIDETFLKANITPDIVMSALDADVIKTYVELGLGIGIIASMAYQKDRDTQLTLLESSHLFSNNTTRIAIRKGHYLRGYAYKFIELCSKELTESDIKLALSPNQPELE
ncbi:MAG: CysB family HTH-type transcriptional regulator [Polynucleobacter victoriensis]|jgi:LysR family cys regulon transcriptional activator|uniref:LysR family transcriptional regulator, cys regulon transcriptional activator n=1 Tax=Polynucleobacter victoriensis TaxID=2049319 RepID=A0A212T4B7_9BURK|nr:CysB family HTH-type transcriptional regulator [Polynucleobacter victoriensis]SNC60614.1 LysR family transcriptional regulator, cys regulon transcriptional activator [Polynucleobacter victoriensis]